MPLLIVEGPERCGKSSLIHIIRDQQRRDGRQRHDPIWNWCNENRVQRINDDRAIHRGEHEMLLRMLPELQDRLVICDRLHLSEWVYGSLENSFVDWVWDFESRLLDRVGRHNIAVVMCLPSDTDEDRDAVWARLEKSNRMSKSELETIMTKFRTASKYTKLPIRQLQVYRNSPPSNKTINLSSTLGRFLKIQGIL